MTTVPIYITPFQSHHQANVDDLMRVIAAEFTDTIFSPQSKTMTEVSLLPTDKYWVACVDNVVVGTIGLSMLKNNNIVLKRMFLNKAFRGQSVAQMLLDTLINFSINHNVSNIYLGTMIQFKAAQKFYEKNNFIKITPTDLPTDFIINPVDTIFYKRDLRFI